MIRNLNQVNFKRFGTISPERGSDNRPAGMAYKQTLELHSGNAPVYYSEENRSWLNCGAGMTILSVSEDGQEYQHFYLDKPVCIFPGIYFSLAPLQDTSKAELSSRSQPQITGTRERDSDLVVRHQLRVGDIYTFFYHEKEMGFVFSGESHSMPELTYVDKGTLHSVADGTDILLEQGDLVIYSPDQWHMQYSDVDVAPRYVTITFDLEGEELSSLYNRKFKAPQQVVMLLQQMLREQEQEAAYSDDMILCLLSQLLLTLLRSSDRSANAKLRAVNAVHSENEIIRKAQQYVSAHIREKLSVPLVAKSVDVSASYLTALFHKNLKIAPGEYIRRVKLQESKQMIREDNMNFTEIAATLRYSNVHHFSRQFKEKFGITPSEYAKSVR